MSKIASSSIRVGTLFEFEGHTYKVLKYEHIKMGRGQATIRVKVQDLQSGVIVDKTFSNENSVNEANAQKQTSQYLYKDDKSAYFMNSEDFTQFEFPLEQIKWEIGFLIEGGKVVTLYIDGNPVSIEIPKTAELKIDETSDAVAGNTATNALKDAILETGLKVRVPLFLKVGDYVKINTETAEYIGRVN